MVHITCTEELRVTDEEPNLPNLDVPKSVSELIVFMYYVGILIALPGPHLTFRKMLLYVRRYAVAHSHLLCMYSCLHPSSEMKVQYNDTRLAFHKMVHN